MSDKLVYLARTTSFGERGSNRKLAMIAICNAAGDRGDGASCSITDIMETADCSERTAQTIRKEFVSKGLITYTKRGGNGPSDRAVFKINVELLEDLNHKVLRYDELVSHKKGATTAPIKKGATKGATKGAICADLDLAPRARAQIESPTEITSSEREVASPSRSAASPHMNCIGFVISSEHNIVVPMKTVDRWREKYPAIPDLDAQMGKLASVILQKGFMHPGWQCPEGWMAGCLAQDNAKAEREAKVAEARIARASGSKPTDEMRQLAAIVGRPV